MKVRLKHTIPVGKEHGMTAGRELETIEFFSAARRDEVKAWVMGDAGEKVGLLRHEFEVVKEEDKSESG
jgi:hypothetical protein